MTRTAVCFLFLAALAAFVPGASPALAADTAAPATRDAETLLEDAGRAAREGRHADAARDYEAARELLPARRAEITALLAYQYAWAGDLSKSDAAFREARAANRADMDLEMGHLLVTNWMGHHLEAAEGYERLARRHPQDPRPLVGLATAQNWMGRQDLALKTLERVRALDPENADAARLEASIRGGLRPVAGLFYDWSEDSDDYQVNSLWVEEAFSPHPQVRLAPYVNVVGVRRPASPAIDETWLGVSGSAAPWTQILFRGRLGFLLDPESGSTYSPVTYELGVEGTADDRLRAGFTTSRFLSLSYNTLPEKVTGHTYGVWVEALPDYLTRVRGAMDVGFYDPVAGFAENRHINLWLTGSRQVWAPAKVRAGALFRYLDFRITQPVGIWNPDEYWAAAGTVEWDYGLRDVWSVNGALELGPGQEKGGDVTLYMAWRLGVARALGRWSLDASIGHSEGNVGSWTGYDRSWAHVGARYRF